MKTLIPLSVLITALGMLSGCTLVDYYLTKSAYPDQFRSDSKDIEIATEIRKRLKALPALDVTRVSIEVVAKRVVLSGIARSDSERDQIGRIARAVTGVIDVAVTLSVSTR